jgi:hypothetical protein
MKMDNSIKRTKLAHRSVHLYPVYDSIFSPIITRPVKTSFMSAVVTVNCATKLKEKSSKIKIWIGLIYNKFSEML